MAAVWIEAEPFTTSVGSYRIAVGIRYAHYPQVSTLHVQDGEMGSDSARWSSIVEVEFPPVTSTSYPCVFSPAQVVYSHFVGVVAMKAPQCSWVIDSIIVVGIIFGIEIAMLIGNRCPHFSVLVIVEKYDAGIGAIVHDDVVVVSACQVVGRCGRVVGIGDIDIILILREQTVRCQLLGIFIEGVASICTNGERTLGIILIGIDVNSRTGQLIGNMNR